MKQLSLILLLLLFSVHADAVVQFTDTYTTGADTDLPTYDAVHYDETTVEDNGAYHLSAEAATGHATFVDTGDGRAISVRIIGAGIPTGDQKITATVNSDGNNEQAGLIVRNNGTDNFYLAYFYNDLVQLYRYDGGAFTLLTEGSRTFSYPATAYFQAVGTGATVALTAQIGGTALVTYNDTDAARITSGNPGLRLYIVGSSQTHVAYFDDVSVDDLSAASGVVARHRPIVFQ